MSHTLLAILLLCAWTFALVTWIVGLRSVLTLAGKVPAGGFSVTGADVSPFAARLCRAHANCYEHLPFYIAVMFAALASGNAAITDPLALVLVGARVCQTAVHLSSATFRVAIVRFVFLVIQLAIAIYWCVALLLRL